MRLSMYCTTAVLNGSKQASVALVLSACIESVCFARTVWLP